jgi:hypothetical protein
MLSTGEGFVTAVPCSGMIGDIGWSMRGAENGTKRVGDGERAGDGADGDVPAGA